MFCPNCGGENLNEAKFCKNCGDKISKEHSRAALNNSRPVLTENLPGNLAGGAPRQKVSMNIPLSGQKKTWKFTKAQKIAGAVISVLVILGVGALAHIVSQSSQKATSVNSFNSSAGDIKQTQPDCQKTLDDLTSSSKTLVDTNAEYKSRTGSDYVNYNKADTKIAYACDDLVGDKLNKTVEDILAKKKKLDDQTVLIRNNISALPLIEYSFTNSKGYSYKVGIKSFGTVSASTNVADAQPGEAIITLSFSGGEAVITNNTSGHNAPSFNVSVSPFYKSDLLSNIYSGTTGYGCKSWGQVNSGNLSKANDFFGDATGRRVACTFNLMISSSNSISQSQISPGGSAMVNLSSNSQTFTVKESDANAIASAFQSPDGWILLEDDYNGPDKTKLVSEKTNGCYFNYGWQNIAASYGKLGCNTLKDLQDQRHK